MSFAVCRMQKMKSHSLRGMQIHNQREKESRTNPDIDPEKTHLNYDLHNESEINYRERVKEIISSEKTDDRKVRKDAVMVNELLVTSGKEFFDDLTEDEQKRYFEESYAFFKDRYGENNVAYATVHYDEKTPHMHMGVVPIMEGKLQSKNLFNRMELRNMQDEFHAHVTGKGFDLERGVKSDRKHIELGKFKVQTLQKENENLVALKEALEGKVALAENKALIVEQKLEKVQDAFEIKDREFNELKKDIESTIPKIESVDEVKTTDLRLRKGYVAVEKNKFDYLAEVARKWFLNDQKVEGLQKEIQTLQKDNKGLSEDFERERNQVHQYELRDSDFRNKISAMERENKNLVQDLTDSKFVAAKLKELVQKMKRAFLKLGQKDFVKDFEKTEDRIEKELPSKQNEYELDR